jgi:hypothetical protein
MYYLISPKNGIYGEHYQLGVITDNIILDCQVKSISQGVDVKQCSSFDT